MLEQPALDNRCPHQGRPLGERSPKNGWLRCPWHAWDYHPLTGNSPGSFEDGHSNSAFAVAIRRVVEREHERAEPKLRYVGIRHEGAAAFAVSAYGKLTGDGLGATTRDFEPRFDDPQDPLRCTKVALSW